MDPKIGSNIEIPPDGQNWIQFIDLEMVEDIKAQARTQTQTLLR